MSLWKVLCRKEPTEVKMKEGRDQWLRAFRRSIHNNVAEIMDAKIRYLYFILQDQPENQKECYNCWLYGLTTIL
jgi:hypothetical protein